MGSRIVFSYHNYSKMRLNPGDPLTLPRNDNQGSSSLDSIQTYDSTPDIVKVEYLESEDEELEATTISCGNVQDYKQTCCIAGCASTKHTATVKLHSFPDIRSWSNNWKRYIRGHNGSTFEFLPGMLVCSKHFTQDSFGPNGKLLYSVAVPNTFPLHAENGVCKSAASIPIEDIWLKSEPAMDPISPQEDPMDALLKAEPDIDEWDAETIPDITMTNVVLDQIKSPQQIYNENVVVTAATNPPPSMFVSGSAPPTKPLHLIQPNQPVIQPRTMHSSVQPVFSKALCRIRFPGDVKKWTIDDVRSLSIENIWRGLQVVLKEQDRIRAKEHTTNMKLRRRTLKVLSLSKKIAELEGKTPPVVTPIVQEPHRFGDLESMASRVNRFGFKVADACRFCFRLECTMQELNQESDVNKSFKQLTGEEIAHGPGIPAKVCTLCYRAIGEHAVGASALRDVNRKWKIRSAIYEKVAPTGQNLALVCYECGKICQHLGALSKHRKTVHPPSGPGTCPTCSKEFKNQLRLSVHMLRHNEKQFVCDICGHAVHMKKDMKRHMIYKHHRGQRPPARTTTGQFRCTGVGCAYTSDDRATCDAHIIMHGKDGRNALGKRKRRSKAEMERDRGGEANQAASGMAGKLHVAEMGPNEPRLTTTLENMIDEEAFLGDWMFEQADEGDIKNFMNT